MAQDTNKLKDDRHPKERIGGVTKEVYCEANSTGQNEQYTKILKKSFHFYFDLID